MKKSLILLSAIGFVTACAPPIETREYAKPRQNFDTQYKDTDLQLRHSSIPANVLKKAVWKEEISSAKWLNTAETLIRIGREDARPKLERKGEILTSLFYNTRNSATDPQFIETLFVKTAIDQNVKYLNQYLDEQTRMLDDSKALILTTIKNSRDSFPFPRKPVKASKLKGEAQKYIDYLVARLINEGLNQEVVTELRAAIREFVDPEIRNLEPYLQAVIDAKTTRRMLVDVQRLMVELGAEVDAETKKLIDEADVFAKRIDEMKTGDDALAVLIAVWDRMPAPSREGQLKPVSKDLYNFFAGLSQNEWRCLKNPDCDALINFNVGQMKMAWAKKKIKGELEKFGVDKLKLVLDEAARKELMALFEEKSTALLTELPRVALEKVEPHLGKPYVKVNAVRADAKGFIRNLVEDFAKKRLSLSGETIRGVEAARVRVAWTPGKSIRLTAVKPSASALETGASVIGASFALAESRLGPIVGVSASQEPDVMRDAIAQVNKLMAISGFDQGAGKIFPAYTISHQEGRSAKHFNLEADLDSSLYYAVPERFFISEKYNFVQAHPGRRSATVASQAEMLRGLSAMIRYLKDWKKNSFDQGIATLKAGDLIGDKMGGGNAMNAKLFDKSLMFTLAVGNAAVILKGFEFDEKRNLSNAYMTNPNGDVIWLDKFKETSDTNTVMTGAVDIVNGQRQAMTRTGDLASLLLAISDFIEATEGIDKTKSVQLRKKDENGKATYSKIVDAREKLQSLMMTIPNFLASKMIRQDGLMSAEYDIERKVKIGVASAAEHAFAIRALITASKYTKISAHVIAAIDTYYAMNAKLWNKDTMFYNERINLMRLPNPADVISIIDNLDELKYTLPEDSQVQWEQISRPWLRAFENL